jgi:predicted nucleic acid-binding Zn ribbon protein
MNSSYEQKDVTLEEINRKLDVLQKEVHQAKMYMLWMLVLSVLMIFLPIIGAILLVPFLMSSLASLYGGVL